MWKRRAEIAVLALLVVVAGAERPRVHVQAPSIDVAALLPDRIEPDGVVARVAVVVVARLLD